MTAVREALRGQLLRALELAWRTDGVGSMNVGEHYVQWAKFSTYLQVECVSNAFLDEDDQLGFVQRRLLAQLGFASPNADVPNYFICFDAHESLPTAADLLVDVVEQVLDVTELQHLVPRRGTVCVVVPVGKCGREPLERATAPMLSACSVRRETTVIEAHSNADDAVLLTDWLASPVDELPQRLQHPLPDDPAGAALLRWCAALGTACERLRRRGGHVFVMAPALTPMREELYCGVVKELADSVFAVLDHEALRLCAEPLQQLLSGWRARTVAAVYGDVDVVVPGADHAFRFDAEGASGVPFDPAMARAAGLWELVLDDAPRGERI